MLKIHRFTENNAEAEAANTLGKRALAAWPELETSNEIVLEIFPSVQCYGQIPQDIDLLVIFGDYRSTDRLYPAKNGLAIHSFCATIELKGHSPEYVQFNGSRCSVMYRNERHDVTAQSEKQKYAVRDYILRNGNKRRAPWISNLIWLTRVPSKDLPTTSNNLLGLDCTWFDLLEKISMLQGNNPPNPLITFDRPTLTTTANIFSKRLQASKIDRKRLEAITRRALDQQQYAAQLGDKLLMFRGLGGTGKTVRLIQIAYQAYNELGLRVLLLTYNKALVADLRRLLALRGVKDAIGESSIVVKTIHSFVGSWLDALNITGKRNFLLEYSKLKLEALNLLKGGALTEADIDTAKAGYSRSLVWDIILIDESQDWPSDERDLLYRLYGHKKILLADGINQLVRGVDHIDWREGLSIAETQVIPLRKSLRLKANLCKAVGHIAEQLEITGWNLEPEEDAYGGKVIVIEGNAFSEKLHNRIAVTAKNDGNKPIDILLCVPPSWVVSDEKVTESLVARKYREWGWEVWDGVDSEERSGYPTSLEQFRIVQYESCRGLEGWVVVAFGLDEFFRLKTAKAEFGDAPQTDMFFDKNAASLEYAKKWLMIPLTRAIDTLVLHISDPYSFVGCMLKDMKNRYPDEIEWIKYE